jgi:hypothetical protein
VLAAAARNWYTAPDQAARERMLVRMRRFFDGWEEGGARLLASFDDDYFAFGQPSSLDYSIYVLYEVDSLDLVAGRIQSAREEIDGLRLDSCFRVECRIGRPLFLVAR